MYRVCNIYASNIIDKFSDPHSEGAHGKKKFCPTAHGCSKHSLRGLFINLSPWKSPLPLLQVNRYAADFVC